MKIIELEEVESTNTYAKNLATNGAEHMTVIWAHKQTAGRGSKKRKWVSIEGNLFWSVIIRPHQSWPRSGDLVYVNSLALLQSIQKVDSDHERNTLSLKWPNDLIIGNNKVAGSLIECAGKKVNGHPEWIVIGTGVNIVDHPPVESGMLYPPTSLKNNGFDVSREELAIELATQLEKEINSWLALGFNDVKTRYLKYAFRLGQNIAVGLSMDKSKYKTGKYLGIDDSGALMIETESLGVERIHSGDVLLIEQ